MSRWRHHNQGKIQFSRDRRRQETKKRMGGARFFLCPTDSLLDLGRDLGFRLKLLAQISARFVRVFFAQGLLTSTVL